MRPRIAQCCDTVYATDVRVGIRARLWRRRAGRRHHLGTAARAALHPGAAGYNHLLASRTGEIVNLEASATRHGLPAAGPRRPHQPLRQPGHGGGGGRTRGAQTLARPSAASPPAAGELPRTIDAERLVGDLADHDGFPHSICSTCCTDHRLDNQVTIGSVVINLTDRTLSAGWGNPCQATFLSIALPQEW
jgi:hypothetical protein